MAALYTAVLVLDAVVAVTSIATVLLVTEPLALLTTTS